ASERTRAEELVPGDRVAAALWNAAVMEFGALVCTARRPACSQCPLTSCAWREAGYPENAPLRRAQPWIGSDRQIRGAIMAQLRESDTGLAHETLTSHVRAAHPDAPASQVERAIASLIEDSLVEESAGTYPLPRSRLHLPLCQKNLSRSPLTSSGPGAFVFICRRYTPAPERSLFYASSGSRRCSWRVRSRTTRQSRRESSRCASGASPRSRGRSSPVSGRSGCFGRQADLRRSPLTWS